MNLQAGSKTTVDFLHCWVEYSGDSGGVEGDARRVVVLPFGPKAFLLRMRRKGRIRMRRKDEYIVGHRDHGIVAAVTLQEVAKAIAHQLWHEHPTGCAYITHRGKTWRYTGQWVARE